MILAVDKYARKRRQIRSETMYLVHIIGLCGKLGPAGNLGPPHRQCYYLYSVLLRSWHTCTVVAHTATAMTTKNVVAGRKW